MNHSLNRAACFVGGAFALAGCTTYEPFDAGTLEAPTPNFPTRLPPGGSPAAPASQEPPVPQARPTTPVEARALQPVAPGPSYVTPSSPPAPSPAPQAPPGASYAPLPPPPPTYDPPAGPQQPTPPPPPATRTVTRMTVTGKVVDVIAPPVTYTVKKGDNLDSIARKLDTTRKQLADDNKLKAPYALRPGDELKGPAGKAKAYVVGSGDTLFAISRRFGVTAKALAEANDITERTSLRSGRKLTLPEGFKDKGPIQTRVTVAVPAPPAPPAPPRYTPPAPAYTPPAQSYSPPAPAYTPPASPPPTPPRNTPPTVSAAPPAVRYEPVPRPPAAGPAPSPTPPAPVRPAPVPARPAAPASPPTPTPTTPPPVAGRTAPVIVPGAGPLSDSHITQIGRGRFQWPLRGEVISDFGPKGTGQRNDGVNIRANTGDPVRASAAGDVVYAGDQVPGFGNLVLIKHPDGWVTAYGHLARVDVKMQQKVAQGQQIGQAGSTGGAAEPQLHFEVRYAPSPADRARPVNPSLVLP